MLFINQTDALISIPKLTLLWPVKWGAWLSRDSLILGVAAFSMFSQFLAFLFPGRRICRCLAAISYLFVVSLDFAYGNIGHAAHATLWVMLVLCLAPDWNENAPTRNQRERMLLNFFFCQVLLGFFYFLAGGWKVLMAFSQLFAGEPNSFQLDVLSRVLAERLLLGNTRTIFGPWLIDHAWIGFFAFWLTVYAEITIFFAAFRPHLHRIIGVLLILFHMVAVITLAPNFGLNVVLLGIFFVMSPFHPENWSLIQAARSLPGAGLFSLLKGFTKR